MPVLTRYRRPLLAQARFSGPGLICGGTDPDRRAITTLLVSAQGGEPLSDSWLALPHADGSHAARAATAPLDGHVHIPARQ